jgi:hypothetical protein
MRSPHLDWPVAAGWHPASPLGSEARVPRSRRGPATDSPRTGKSTNNSSAGELEIGMACAPIMEEYFRPARMNHIRMTLCGGAFPLRRPPIAACGGTSPTREPRGMPRDHNQGRNRATPELVSAIERPLSKSHFFSFDGAPASLSGPGRKARGKKWEIPGSSHIEYHSLP